MTVTIDHFEMNRMNGEIRWHLPRVQRVWLMVAIKPAHGVACAPLYLARSLPVIACTNYASACVIVREDRPIATMRRCSTKATTRSPNAGSHPLANRGDFTLAAPRTQAQLRARGRWRGRSDVRITGYKGPRARRMTDVGPIRRGPFCKPACHLGRAWRRPHYPNGPVAPGDDPMVSLRRRIRVAGPESLIWVREPSTRLWQLPF